MTVRILIVTIHVLGYSSYRVKYRSVEEGSRAEEILVRAEEEDPNTVTLDLQVRGERSKPRSWPPFSDRSQPGRDLQDEPHRPAAVPGGVSAPAREGPPYWRDTDSVQGGPGQRKTTFCVGLSVSSSSVETSQQDQLILILSFIQI